ncbi:hypothetical protein N201_02540 [Helicobacter pylori UM066]|nr:hypothetical protein N201_02540 [Helicobacter pylori UM066]
MVYFKTGSAFLGWLARALKRVCCKIVSRSIVLGYGVNEGHGMKLKVGSVKVSSALLR